MRKDSPLYIHISDKAMILKLGRLERSVRINQSLFQMIGVLDLISIWR